MAENTALKSFVIDLGFNTNQSSFNKFHNNINRATADAFTFGNSLSTEFKYLERSALFGLGGIAKYFAIFGAAVQATSLGIVEYVEKTAEKLENLAILSDRLKISATQIEKFSFIASQSQSSAQAAQGSLESLARNAGNVYLGIGRYSTKIFQKLGIAVTDSNGKLKNTYDLMFEIGGKIKNLDRIQQISILSKLGIDPSLLKTITGDIGELGNEFDKLNKGIDLDEAAKSSLEFLEGIKKLKYSFGKLGESVSLSVMPGLTRSIETLTKTVVNNLPKITDTLKPIINIITTISMTMFRVIYRTSQVASSLIDIIVKLNKATHGWSATIAGLIVGFKLLNRTIKSGPVGAILLLAGALYLLYDDFKTAQEGGKSFIQWGKTSGKVIFNVIFALGTLSSVIYGVSVAMRIARNIQIAYTAALVVFKTTVTAARGAVELLSTAMEFGFVGAYATLGLIVADVVLLVDKIKELTKLFDQLNSTRSGTEERSNILKEHAGILSFLPGGVLGASVYNQPINNNRNYTTPDNKNINTQNISQNTTITVHGTTDPAGTANKIADQQSRRDADRVRNGKVIAR